jgi:hypothetical protein
MTAGTLAGAVAGGVAALVGAAVGAIGGAFVGWRVSRRISDDDWDPGLGEKPFVGAHSPDTEMAAGSGLPARPT